MMAGVKILKLGVDVGDGRIRRVVARRHPASVDGCRLRASIGDPATISGPSVGDLMLRVETGARRGDLHRVWRKNLGRRGRGGAGQWRVVVAAQIHNNARRQPDAVPLRRMAADEFLIVVGINVINLRNTNGEPRRDGEIEASTAACGDVTPRPTATIRGQAGRTNEGAGKGRKDVGVVLVLKTEKSIPNTVTILEMPAAVSQETNIVETTKIGSNGSVKAI